MTEDNNIVKVHKIEGDRVEIGLAEFIDMCNAVRSSKEVEEANTWLQKARAALIGELHEAEQKLRNLPKPPEPFIRVFKTIGGVSYAMSVVRVERGDEACTIFVEDSN